jgi:hypothetical protein
MSDADDERRLLDRLATGEPAAFAQLYDIYGARLYRTALARISHRVSNRNRPVRRK